ncbi:hypothetical protein AAF712_009047 [Marasmius tenuissimus]|uniref:Uncharacterized protein n=1 Tax=Marasmius tenuissimus TaxID=585030 RepID=A0ABR2ZS34_9AGAR|nr:hypothetical protein PM082_002048 [Marasmius tenuissimus]
MSSSFFSNARESHILGGSFSEINGDQTLSTTNYDTRITGSYNKQSISGSHNTQSIAGSNNTQHITGDSNRQNIAGRCEQPSHGCRDSTPTDPPFGVHEKHGGPNPSRVSAGQRATETEYKYEKARRGSPWRRWLFGNRRKEDSKGTGRRA